MKIVISFLLWGLFGLQCTRTETITALQLPCDCKEYPMIYEYKSLKGTLIFPRTPTEPYLIIAPRMGGVETTNVFGICSDSVSISQIKQGKFSDSSAVLFDGGALNVGRDNGAIACTNRVPFRITRLLKAP